MRRGHSAFARCLDLQRVRDWLGHVSIATTEKYLHTLPDADDSALEALGRVRGRNRPRLV